MEESCFDEKSSFNMLRLALSSKLGRVFVLFILLKLPDQSLGMLFRRFSARLWQNTRVKTARRAIMCDVYFSFTKIL